MHQEDVTIDCFVVLWSFDVDNASMYHAKYRVFLNLPFAALLAELH